MQRNSLYNFCFLLATLLIFVASCGKGRQAQLQLPVKRGTLVVISEPMGAKVYIDDKLMGDTVPLVLKDVPAGSYKVKMELERYLDFG